MKKRKIVIECMALRHMNVGIGQFLYHIGLELGVRAEELRSEHGIELYFILPKSFVGCFGKDVHYITTFPIFRWLLALNPFKIDLFHMPHQYCTFKHLNRCKDCLLTIHDINFMYEKKGYKLYRYIRGFNKKVRLATYINYISNFTRNDVNKNFEINVPERVIYNGVTEPQGKFAHETDRLKKLPQTFFFHISSLLPKKNVNLLISMMKFLPKENLVIAGDWQGKNSHILRQQIVDEGLTNVYALDNVSEEEKSWLFSKCRAFLFPSLCEGFGLPPIEAMKCGKPVFLSTLTSLPEIGADAAYYWPKLEPQSMAELLIQKLEEFNHDPDALNRIHINANRFNWKKCVDGYVDYYLDILGIKLD